MKFAIALIFAVIMAINIDALPAPSYCGFFEKKEADDASEMFNATVSTKTKLVDDAADYMKDTVNASGELWKGYANKSFQKLGECGNESKADDCSDSDNSDNATAKSEDANNKSDTDDAECESGSADSTSDKDESNKSSGTKEDNC